MQNREADQERDSDFQSRMSLLSEIPSGKIELLPDRLLELQKDVMPAFSDRVSCQRIYSQPKYRGILSFLLKDERVACN